MPRAKSRRPKRVWIGLDAKTGEIIDYGLNQAELKDRVNDLPIYREASSYELVAYDLAPPKGGQRAGGR